MSKLTNKQLYGYSIMKWKRIKQNLEKINDSIYSKCSFCLDSESKQQLYSCKIDMNICNCIFHCEKEFKPISTNFNDFAITITKTYLKLNLLIKALREKYYEN